MKRLQLLGMLSVGLLAFAMSVTATAPADLGVLPTPTEANPLNFTAEGGSGEFVTATGRLECETFAVEGSLISATSGTGHIHFLGCKVIGGNKCKSGTDANGHVLYNGTGQMVDLLSGGVLTLGFALVLTEPVMITCGVGKIEKIGSVLGAIDGPKTLVKTKTGTFLFHESAGKQEFTECDLPESLCLEAGKHKKFELLAKFTSEEAFKPGILIGEGKGTLAKEVEVHF